VKEPRERKKMGFWDEEESKKKEIMSLPFRQPYGMEHYF
jgi:hypothetical protein